MPTKDRWSALSMKDKAVLIKLMIENGITSLDDMKLYYNGGDKDEEEENKWNITTNNEYNLDFLKKEDSKIKIPLKGEKTSTELEKEYNDEQQDKMNPIQRLVRKRRQQKLFNDVTERIANPPQGGLKVNPETGVRYEEPLEEKHPGLTIGLMAAQPGTILEKVLAPIVYKGVAKSISEGNLSEALMSSVSPVKIAGLLPAQQVVKDMNGFVRKGSQFRIVDKPAIEDAIESRVIRSKTGLYHGVPEYLRENFSGYLEKIPGWEKMDAGDIRVKLEELGAFSNMSKQEKLIAKFNIRNSTNHGGTVGYFKDTPYPNYEISPTNYIIETPSSPQHFAPGHHGKIFDWPLESRKTGATVLINEEGAAAGASIPVDGSVYWEFNPELGGWITKNFKYGGGIHIKPENKGKFTATKKRTGKTTEELTHSKNPLTRKRAIFAQNAKKWHHAEGGPLGDKDTLSHPQYNSNAESAMYNYLYSKGLNDAQVSGIMGNLAVESLLNSDINQFNGPAYGLIQAEGARKKALKSYKGDPYVFGSGLLPEEQKQLDYIVNMGINNYTPGEWGKQGYSGARAARKAFIDSSDVKDASDIITRNYLRPSKPHTKRRRDMSEYYFDKYGHKNWDFIDSKWNVKNILKK